MTSPALLEPYRRELTGYCYRMLGSGFEAEDAVQDTFVKAWKNYDTFEGRSSLRSWLYRIATNVCLDMVRGPQRRARPMEFGPSSPIETAAVGPVHPEKTWIQPIPDAKVVPTDGDPADIAMARETIRLAFIAALQNLPPKQRSVLILREVLRWQATEVAELLDTSVASVNSALQRARETMGDLDLDGTKTAVTGEQEALLAKYVDAFERYDVDELVTLLRDDVILSMPPFALWLRGPDELRRLVPRRGHRAARGRGSSPRRPTAASPSARTSSDGNGGTHRGRSRSSRSTVTASSGHHNFLNTELFEYFGLPDAPARRLA